VSEAFALGANFKGSKTIQFSTYRIL